MPSEVNQIVSFEFDTEASKTAAIGYKPEDLYKVAIVKATGALYLLASTFPIVWAPIDSQGGGSALAMQEVLSGASAGSSSAWLPRSSSLERLAYALDSGTAATTFSIDISNDGVNFLAQAFTGNWASTTAEITPPIFFNSVTAKFFRINILSGGPISFIRGV